MTFCFGKLGVVIIGVLIWFAVIIRVFSIQVTTVMRYLRVPTLATVAMAAVTIGLDLACSRVFQMGGLIVVSVVIPAGILTYVLALYVLDPTLFRRLMSLGRRAIGARPKGEPNTQNAKPRLGTEQKPGKSRRGVMD